MLEGCCASLAMILSKIGCGCESPIRYHIHMTAESGISPRIKKKTVVVSPLVSLCRYIRYLTVRW